MEKPGVEVGLLFRRVAGRVIDQTGGTQRPEVLVRLATEYYLAEPPASLVLAAAPAPAPVTPLTAPVDVQPVAPSIVAAGPSASDVTARDTARQAALAADQPDAADRAALWGYMAALTESPFEVPVTQWVAPERGNVAEAEPNDSFGAAQPVNPNDELSVTIGQNGDTDWFRVQVLQGGTLTVRAPAPPAALDVGVRLLNANAEELVYWIVAPRPGGELFAEFDLPRPGTYWLQFVDSANDASSTDAFAVDLSYVVQPDGFEPNDRIDLARHVPLDGSFPLNILPKGDHDWFEFSTDAPGALLVASAPVPEAIDGTFRLLNADGVEQVYWIAAPRPGGDTVAVLDLPKPGVYYLEIADGTNDARSTEPLTLTTRFAKSPDLYEPNDSMAQAMPVPTRASTRWRSSRPATTTSSRSTSSSPASSRSRSRRRRKTSTSPSACSTPTAPRPSTGPLPRGPAATSSAPSTPPGPAAISSSSPTANNDAGSIEPFTLNLELHRQPRCLRAQRHSIGTASVLTAGGEVPFTVFPKTDGDWFRVTVTEPGELAVTIDEGPENLDITYRVINTDWNELVYWTNAYRKGGLTEGFADLPRPGTYYLEVRDGNNDDRSIEPATLKTVFTPTHRQQRAQQRDRRGDPGRSRGRDLRPHPARSTTPTSTSSTPPAPAPSTSRSPMSRRTSTSASASSTPTTPRSSTGSPPPAPAATPPAR